MHLEISGKQLFVVQFWYQLQDKSGGFESQGRINGNNVVTYPSLPFSGPASSNGGMFVA